MLPPSKDSVVLSQSKLSGHLSTELILRFLCTTLCFGIQGSQHSAYPLPYNSQNALIAIQSAIWAPRNTFQVSSKKQLPALTMSETDWSAKPGFIDLKDTGAFFLACVPALHTFIAVKTIIYNFWYQCNGCTLKWEATTLSAAVGHAVVCRLGKCNLKTEHVTFCWTNLLVHSNVQYLMAIFGILRSVS